MPRLAVVRTTLAIAALSTFLTACSDSSAPASPISGTETTAPTASAGADKDTLIISSVNFQMRIRSFHASGTTTALGGGSTEMWWVPQQGLHVRTTSDRTGKTSDVFCKDGTTYTSATLLADALRQSGRADPTVPSSLSDAYVTSQGQPCDAYYKIPEMAKPEPEQDSTVNGVKTFAVAAAAGPTQDVYQIANEGTYRLLQQKSTRDGRTSTTTYDSFGEKFTITMPPKDKTITMSEFRSRVG